MSQNVCIFIYFIAQYLHRNIYECCKILILKYTVFYSFALISGDEYTVIADKSPNSAILKNATNSIDDA